MLHLISETAAGFGAELARLGWAGAESGEYRKDAGRADAAGRPLELVAWHDGADAGEAGEWLVSLVSLDDATNRAQVAIVGERPAGLTRGHLRDAWLAAQRVNDAAYGLLAEHPGA